MFRLSTKAIIISALICFAGLVGLQLVWLKSAYQGELALYTRSKKQFEYDLQTDLKNNAAFKKISGEVLHTHKTKRPLPSAIQKEFLSSFGQALKDFTDRSPYVREVENYGIIQHRHLEAKGKQSGVVILSKEQGAVESDLSTFGKLCLHCVLGVKEEDHEQYNYQLFLFYRNERAVIYGRLFWMIAGSFLLILLLGILFRQMLRKYRQEYKLSEAKNDFINNLSHELQTPVFAVQMANRMIKENSAGQQKIGSYTAIIEKETSQIKGHVSKILELASLENEQIELKKERIDLNAFLEQRRPTIQLMLQSKQGELVINASAGAVYSCIDTVHFNNVLTSLVDNAIKYNDTQPHIVVTTGSVQDKIFISISDN
ncbi:MAG TPA: HAMP domain-containing sensor histidine kinase, partial [Flavobacterium sp.]|nr:HAMP domain-containing sensor histidine kinase [Flavobacterium sp.]